MEPHELTELVRRNAGLIHRIAYAYCREAGEREEVVQEVAFQLWRSRDRLDPGRRESTWVYRIALNVAISFQRRERRHREGRVALGEQIVTIAAATEAEPSQEVQLLLRCIDELGTLEKPLVLLYLDGNDHASIAEVLGISASNVGTRLARIKDKLREALERREDSERRAKHAAR